MQSPCVHVERDLIEKQETCVTRAHEVREEMVGHSAGEGGRDNTRNDSVGHIEHLCFLGFFFVCLFYREQGSIKDF